MAARAPRFCVCGWLALESQGFFRADVAQLAEHITRNDGVLGSIPSVGSKKAQQTAAFLFRPTLANDAALPTFANIRPQIAWFLALFRMFWKRVAVAFCAPGT